MIEKAIQEDPPISIRDGDIIKDGYHEDVDRFRKAKTEGKSWLAKLEAEEAGQDRYQKSENQVQ